LGLQSLMLVNTRQLCGADFYTHLQGRRMSRAEDPWMDVLRFSWSSVCA